MEPQRPSVAFNYLYFGIFFVSLLFLATCSVFLKENLIGSRFFFWFYSAGQSAMEVATFIFLGWLLYLFLGNFAFWIFIGLTFVSYVLHLFDFMMDRILDLSVWETMAFVFDGNIKNFFYLLDASGIPFWAWILGFILLVCLPLFGIILYKMTNWFSKKKQIAWPYETFLQLFVCIPAALLFWDFSASRVIQPDAYTDFLKSLPWKQTFLKPHTVFLESGLLRTPPPEGEIGAEIEKNHPLAGKKPNIFLFVVESLREDFVTPEVAPSLSHFREENIHGKVSLSNANGTNLSWFSIFHSQFSFFWKKRQEEKWKMGSPALALFKQLGYKIRVYSSAELGYYGMESLLLGENNSLADTFSSFHQPAPYPVCHADRDALVALKKDLPQFPDGNFFIIFWDSTHFDYSWPKETGTKFSPFGSEMSYFKAYQSSRNIELIKNRYRNAVHYVDSLFGEFLQIAPSESMIVFTGDHGEEFFDHGHLFHNSHLTKEQTNVPIYFKIGDQKLQVPLVAQVDIMPTLLDAVAHTSFPFLQGESILQPKKWPFTAISRFNGGRSPYEFCLHNGENKVIAQFTDRKNIFASSNLQLLSLRTAEDRCESRKKAAEWIDQEFKEGFHHLFEGMP